MTLSKWILLLAVFPFTFSMTGCSHKPAAPNTAADAASSSAPNEQQTRDGIRKNVESHVPDVEQCYATIVNDNPQSQGQIVVQWTIGEGGKVVDAGIKSSEVHSQKLEDCIVAKVRTWTFPAPPRGQQQVINYPFLFRAVD